VQLIEKINEQNNGIGKLKDQKESKERPPSMVEMYYKRIVRIAEYYIFLCFIIIAIVLPFMLEYDWVDSYIKFIYFTAFPLLIILLVVSLIKEPFLTILKNRFEEPSNPSKSPRGK
jgi:hypothetical protein